jgi:peptidylprolyl isomerase
MESSKNSKAVLAGALIFVVALVAVVLIVQNNGGDDDADPATLTDLSVKPQIPDQEGDPPTELVTEDLVVGDGPAAKAGDDVEVQYVGVDYETGEQFDASWDNGQPFSFKLGAGQVIPGWDQGVEGMKVGGRRMLTIPPDLAYGPAGSPPAIGPNATLVFVVDLLDVKGSKGKDK